MLSQRQQFLNNHLARVPIIPHQQGTHEMKDEVLSTVGAQKEWDTRGYQVSSDLDAVEFYWENDQLDVDAVFRPGIDSPSHQQQSTTWRWEEVQPKTPFCSTKKKTRRVLLLFQQHQSLRDQHGLLHCWEVVPLEQNYKMFLNMFIELCYKKYYRFCVLIWSIINLCHFMKTVLRN